MTSHQRRFGSGMEDEAQGVEAAIARLNELGISLSAVQDSIRTGQQNADFTTASHPRTYSGIVAWGETIAAFRQQMGTLGWSFTDDDNIPRVVSPSGEVVATCISGNSATGVHGAGIGTRNPRRSAGLRIIRRNAQIEMIELLPDGETGEQVQLVGRTWFLLYFREGDLVRNELTFATGVTTDGKLLEWSERLILPVIDLSDGGGQGSRLGFDRVPPVDVPVQRIAS